jgi:uncharacterized membrane protein HdeD (DUF308 family)
MGTLATGRWRSTESAGPTLGWLAIGFTALGIVSILAPAAATFAATILVASTMVIWGLLGVWMSLSMRRFPEWRFSALAFGAVAGFGLVFLAFPAIGIEAMTLFLVASFLVEGIVSVAFGLRMSGNTGRWGWMTASGFASLVLGFLVLLGWPATASWLLGLLFGVNFLTTGVALFLVRGASKVTVE